MIQLYAVIDSAAFRAQFLSVQDQTTRIPFNSILRFYLLHYGSAWCSYAYVAFNISSKDAVVP